MFLTTAFRARMVAFGTAAAALYGTIRAAREAAGNPIAVQDALIAATARAFGLLIATRSGNDCGGQIVDPWSAKQGSRQTVRNIASGCSTWSKPTKTVGGGAYPGLWRP